MWWACAAAHGAQHTHAYHTHTSAHTARGLPFPPRAILPRSHAYAHHYTHTFRARRAAHVRCVHRALHARVVDGFIATYTPVAW